MPDAVTHLTPQELAAFRLGRLPEAAAAAVADHLATCPACRQAAAGPPPDLPPELAKHPKFRIVRELGRGGMGVIYLAEHRVMQKPVALKVVSPAVLDNPGALARFLGEVRAAGKLDHQNIARAYDADQAGNLHFLVMEYVEGLSLAQLLEQRGPLPVANACHYVRQAALGLHHAFEAGMVHRDIKPQNLMVTPRGLVKVLDFGLARVRDEGQASTRLTRLESFMGTPEYVAPEQATDARQADTRSDIYGLGCTLYALLAGRPPFVADTAVQIVLAHIEKESAPLHELRPDVPAELSAVVAKMLAKDPAQRYQRPIDVAQALVPFVQAADKSETGVVPAPGVTAPTSGTVVGGDTRPEKRRCQEKSKPPATKAARQDSGSPGAPAAWWARPVVIAGAVSAALALVAVAGAIVLILTLTPGGDAPVAVVNPPAGPDRRTTAPPVPQEEDRPPAGPGGDDTARAAQKPSEKPAKPNDNGKAKPAGNAKTAQQKKAEEDAKAEAAKRAQEKKDAEDAAKAKKAAEDRQRKQEEKEAADARKQKAALQKAETDAASQLKLAKKLPDDALNARKDGNTAEEKRLKEQYAEALRAIIKKYPQTKAATEAQELLNQ